MGFWNPGQGGARECCEQISDNGFMDPRSQYNTKQGTKHPLIILAKNRL